MRYQRKQMNNRELYIFQRLMGVKLLPQQIRMLKEISIGAKTGPTTRSELHGKSYLEKLWKEYKRLVDGFV